MEHRIEVVGRTLRCVCGWTADDTSDQDTWARALGHANAALRFQGDGDLEVLRAALVSVRAAELELENDGNGRRQPNLNAARTSLARAATFVRNVLEEYTGAPGALEEREELHEVAPPWELRPGELRPGELRAEVRKAGVELHPAWRWGCSCGLGMGTWGTPEAAVAHLLEHLKEHAGSARPASHNDHSGNVEELELALQELTHSSVILRGRVAGLLAGLARVLRGAELALPLQVPNIVEAMIEVISDVPSGLHELPPKERRDRRASRLHNHTAGDGQDEDLERPDALEPDELQPQAPGRDD